MCVELRKNHLSAFYVTQGTMDDTAQPKTKTEEAPNRPAQLAAVQEEAMALFVKKNADYGDAFATYGAVGVLVRIGDKLQRLVSVSERGINMVSDEGVRDTLIDLHNYAAMAILLMDNK
jgi:hypothetical protein